MLVPHQASMGCLFCVGLLPVPAILGSLDLYHAGVEVERLAFGVKVVLVGRPFATLQTWRELYGM